MRKAGAHTSTMPEASIYASNEPKSIPDMTLATAAIAIINTLCEFIIAGYF